WNQVLLDAIRTDRTPPPPAARAMAIVQAAVFDAVNAIDGSYTPYLFNGAGPKHASLTAAAPQAAHDTLAALYPRQQATFAAPPQADLAGVSNPGALKQGVAVGQEAAAAILQARANDGSAGSVPYTPGSGPGVWQPTPPAFAAALFPQWPDVTPFTMRS